MIYFNMINKSFTQLPGDSCYLIKTQDEVNKISESITGGGDIWVELGKIMCSGKSPSPYHVFNISTKKFEESKDKKAAIINERRTQYIKNIDSHAATIYGQWTRFESEYRERKSVAEEYKAANYQGECSRYITDFAKRAGINNKTATDLILAQASGLEKLQLELANQRMRKYELKAQDLTLDKMESIYEDIIKNMDSLMEAYQNG